MNNNSKMDLKFNNLLLCTDDIKEEVKGNPVKK